MSAKRGTDRRLVELALSPLAARAWRRGVLGGERTWLVVGVGVLALRGLRRRREEEVVFTQALTKGQSLLISHGPPDPTRRARRKAERRDRAAVDRAAAPVLPDPG